MIADSGSLVGEGTESVGREGGGACGCLFSISDMTTEEGVAKPLEVRALMALLY